MQVHKISVIGDGDPDWKTLKGEDEVEGKDKDMRVTVNKGKKN